MKPVNHRPKQLWSQESLTPSVSKYISYLWEFDTDWLDSKYPYRGKASASFRRVLKMDDYEASERFVGKGHGCWALRSDRIINHLTVDLLAAAEALGGKLETASPSSALPGGLGVDAKTVWVALLDGGVGVEVAVWEHEYTNKPKGRQRTTIRGPRAYRALLELLGFDWINRRLAGEEVTPSHVEITTMVNDLLKK